MFAKLKAKAYYIKQIKFEKYTNNINDLRKMRYKKISLKCE